jgi:two-component system LytT family sensor kinase
LSTQILIGKYEEQKQLLVHSEFKLLQAQVNPHFLFNALNTIAAVIRTDPGRARSLLVHLSSFFRTSLKRTGVEVSLRDELAQIDAYLQIEQARFGKQLSVRYSIPEALLPARLPAFTLQPLVENAIKYGVSQMLTAGEIHVAGLLGEDGVLHLSVEDNAGLFVEAARSDDGLGMNIVDRRIKIRHGEQFGVVVECEKGVRTRVCVSTPWVET